MVRHTAILFFVSSFSILNGETPCETYLRLTQYALDAELASPQVKAENQLTELDYDIHPERAEETGTVGRIQPLVTILRSEPRIQYSRPIDINYQISSRGDEVFVIRDYALNTSQHEIESKKQLWYKIKYIETADQVNAELYLLEGSSETKIGQYEMSKTWIEGQRRAGNHEFKIGSPGVRYQLNEQAYEDLKLPAGFITDLRTDLYQIVVEAFLHPRRRAI